MDKDWRCPCCDQPIEEPIVKDGHRIHFGPVQKNIMKLLTKHERLEVRIIADRLCSTPRSIWAAVFKMNQKLPLIGLRIVSTGGPGAVYRLVNIATPPVGASSGREVTEVESCQRALA